MADRDKVLRGWERCVKCNSMMSQAYVDCEYTVGIYCAKDRLINDTIEVLREMQPKAEEQEVVHEESSMMNDIRRMMFEFQKKDYRIYPSKVAMNQYTFDKLHKEVIVCKKINGKPGNTIYGMAIEIHDTLPNGRIIIGNWDTLITNGKE